MLYFPNKRPKREANDLQQLSKRMQHLESYMWIHVVNHVQTTPGRQNTLASPHHDSTQTPYPCDLNKSETDSRQNVFFFCESPGLFWEVLYGFMQKLTSDAHSNTNFINA